MAPPRALVLYGGWLAALTVLTFASPAVGTGNFAVLGLSSSAAIIYGVRRYRPSGVWSWYALAAVPTLASASGVLFVLLPGHIGYLKAYLWAALLIRFVTFACALIGLVGLAHNRASGPEHVRTSVIDVVMLLFGAGLLAGIVATFPFIFGPDRPDLVEAVRAASAASDVVILVAVINLVIVVRWSVPVGLLAVGWLAALIFDAVYVFGGASSTWPTGTPGDLGWILFCGAWGAAALLPGMADLRERDTATFSLAATRLVLLLCALLVPLVALFAAPALGVSWYVLAPTLAFTIMLGLVLTRLVAVMLALRRQVLGERSLREIVTQLAGAADPVAVTAIIERMVPTLLPGRNHDRVEVRRAGEPPRPTAIGLPAVIGDRGRLLTFPLGPDASPDQPMMYVHVDRTGLAASLPRLEVVASQASLSLDRIRLGQEVVRRATEEYFNALVQTAPDGMLMVEDNDRVILASPSAKTILGQSQLEGTWLPGLVDQSQRHAAQQLLAGARGGQAVPPGGAVARHETDRAAPAGVTDTGLGAADPVRWSVPHGDGSTTLVEITCHKVDEELSVRGVMVNLHNLTEQQQLKQELTESTVRDHLTGLPNRLAMLELTRTAVARAASTDAFVGQIHIDFDDFALINDQYGYEVGDLVLQTLAHRLTETAPPGTTAARLGGDAFALLIENASDVAAVGEHARHVAATLRDPIPVADEIVICTASIGVATTLQADSVDDLVSQADFALRAGKATGKGQVRHYDPSMHLEMKDRLELQGALERAIEQKALSLHYQPLIALDTSRTVGFEALLRWHHPTQGWVSPELVIDVAEETGLIEPIGEWVLTTALDQLLDWDQSAPGAVHGIGINVSSHQFRSSGFVQRIRSHLATTGLSPARLNSRDHRESATA